MVLNTESACAIIVTSLYLPIVVEGIFSLFPNLKNSNYNDLIKQTKTSVTFGVLLSIAFHLNK